MTFAGLSMTAFSAAAWTDHRHERPAASRPDTVLLGTSAIRTGKGTMSARLIAPGEVPPGVPDGRLPSTQADGGADASP